MEVKRGRRAAEIVRDIADHVALLDGLVGRDLQLLHVEVEIAVDTPAGIGTQRDGVAADVGDDAILDGDHFVARAFSGRGGSLGLAAFRGADADVLAEMDAGLGAPGRGVGRRAALAIVVAPWRGEVAGVALVAALDAAAIAIDLRLRHSRRVLDREQHVGDEHGCLGRACAARRREVARPEEIEGCRHRRRRCGWRRRQRWSLRRCGLCRRRCSGLFVGRRDQDGAIRARLGRFGRHGQGRERFAFDAFQRLAIARVDVRVLRDRFREGRAVSWCARVGVGVRHAARARVGRVHRINCVKRRGRGWTCRIFRNNFFLRRDLDPWPEQHVVRIARAKQRHACQRGQAELHRGPFHPTTPTHRPIRPGLSPPDKDPSATAPRTGFPRIPWPALR